MRLDDFKLFEHALSDEDYVDAIRAIKNNPGKIVDYIDSDDFDNLFRLALQHDPSAIKFIPDPTPSMQRISVIEVPSSIQYIEHPTAEVQRLAIEKQWRLLRYINKPSQSIVEFALDNGGPQVLNLITGRELTEHDVKAAIRNNVRVTIPMFDVLSHDIQRYAYDLNPRNYILLANLDNIDPSIIKDWSQYIRDKNAEWRKQNMLPMVGNRRSMPGANQDQVVLLRWMEKHNTDMISVRELKKQPWGNTPYFQDLVKQCYGRDITKADVLNYRGTRPGNQSLLKKCTVSIKLWHGVQRLFVNRPNLVAVYGILGSDIMPLTTELDQLQIHLTQYAGHPTPAVKPNFAKPSLGLPVSKNNMVPAHRYTLGWVRFTMFGQDVWVDEVQSDLQKLIEPASLINFKGIQDAILQDFIHRMRKRGAERIFIPSFDIKRDPQLYDAVPPMSIYTDLPKKMRMRKAIVTGIDPLVDGKEAWLLEGNIVSEKMIDRLGLDGKLFLNPTREEFAAIIREDQATMLRMLLDPETGDLYVWDGYYASHGAIKDRYADKAFHLVYELKHPRTITALTLWRYERNGYTREQVEALIMNNPYLSRLVPNMKLVIEP